MKKELIQITMEIEESIMAVDKHVQKMPENPDYTKEFMVEKIPEMIQLMRAHLASAEPKTPKLIAKNIKLIEIMELLLEAINAFPNTNRKWEAIEKQFDNYFAIFYG